MPILKAIAIHSQPMNLFNYIVNGEKTEKMKFVTGISCNEDPQLAYEDFRDIYERYAHESFQQKQTQTQEKMKKGKKRETVLLFHYIQSFRPGEVTPEIAHKIGVQLIKRTFGSGRAVLLCTHDDKDHIHNHFAISVFDNKGKRWYANKDSLKRMREISDTLAKEYGLSIIEPGHDKRNYNYAEWLARKKGTSWKAKIADEIDRIVCKENVKSIDDLMDELAHKGYNVTHGKYLSIRPKGMKRGVRSYRLGDGYSVEVLQYRLQHKDQEISAAEVERYTGIQREYAMCMREMQMAFYRHTEEEMGYKKATYEDLLKTSKLLCYISEQKITTVDIFKRVVNNADEEYRKALQRKKELEERIEFEKDLIERYPEFMELWNKPKRTPKEVTRLGTFQVLIDYDMYEDGRLQEHKQNLKKLEKELASLEKQLPGLKDRRDTAAANYREYLSVTETDYDRILKRMKQEQEERERIEELRRTMDRLEREHAEELHQQSQRRDTWSLGGR